jgi:hypothetical protein
MPPLSHEIITSVIAYFAFLASILALLQIKGYANENYRQKRNISSPVTE